VHLQFLQIDLLSSEFKPSYVNNRGDERRKAGEEEQWNIRTFSVLCRQKTDDFSVGEETGERSKQEASAQGAPASVQGGGLRRPRRRRPRREGVSGVRAGRGVSGVRRRSKQGYPVSGVRKQGVNLSRLPFAFCAAPLYPPARALFPYRAHFPARFSSSRARRAPRARLRDRQASGRRGIHVESTPGAA
jgi:hypothetical protein